MLEDERLAEIHDYPETDLVFPGVNIRGGVCYFGWSAQHRGPITVVNHRRDDAPDAMRRPALLPGISTFVRYNRAVSILKKVRKQGEATYDTKVESRNPFGIPANFSAFSQIKTPETPVLLFRSRRGSSVDKRVFVSTSQIKANLALKGKIKVLVSKASPGGDEYPHAVLGKPIIAPKNSVCTETYLIVDCPRTVDEASNLVSYMNTRFLRFLVSLIKNTQNISKSSFAFVPIQDLSQPWSDEVLYEKYGITKGEASFIESMVRPAGESDD